MDAIARQLEAEHPDSNKSVARAGELRAGSAGPERSPGAADAARRRGARPADRVRQCRQPAARTRASDGRRRLPCGLAIGASRGQIVRQLVVESIVLAVRRGAAGLLLAVWGVSAAVGHRDRGIAPRAGHRRRLAGRAVCVRPLDRDRPGVRRRPGAAGNALRPARIAERGEPRRHRQHTAPTRCDRRWSLRRSHSRWCCSSAPGLLLRSFSALTRVSPGFNPDNLLVINLPLSPRATATTSCGRAAVDRIARAHQRAAGRRERRDDDHGADGRRRRDHPFQPRRLSAEGTGGLRDGRLSRRHAPDYLSTLGVPLQRGRLLDRARSRRRAAGRRHQRVDGAAVFSRARSARAAHADWHRARARLSDDGDRRRSSAT